MDHFVSINRIPSRKSVHTTSYNYVDIQDDGNCKKILKKRHKSKKTFMIKNLIQYCFKNFISVLLYDRACLLIN